MFNTINFSQSRLKQILAIIEKAWGEIDELYYDIGGDSEEDAVRQSIFDACENLGHITRFIKQHITEE